ncbi:MAG: hypothetical protein J6K62_05950 [Clostridia bacterium]|nr:hypothetical protein [Clostridia bacterium]
MKKNFTAYIIGWAAVLAFFNLITFITPGDKFDDTGFTLGYVFITLMFLIQLGCAYAAFSAKNLNRAFYNIPLVKLSIGSLVWMLIVGGVVMAVEAIPTWIGILLCAVVLLFNILGVTKAAVTANVVEGVDRQVKVATVFIKMLTADAQLLQSKTQGRPYAATVTKVYEAVRYSDPMSAQGLADVEMRLRQAFAMLSAAVNEDNAIAVEQQANNVLALVEERNVKCKILK